MGVLLTGCWLEEVTGEAVPLDPRYYADAEETQGMPGVGGGDAVPFGAYKGETVLVEGTITSAVMAAVDVDVRTPDPAAPGGVKGHGKLLLEEPGTFSIAVPKGLGKLELQAFQDQDGDGPTGDDTFAQTNVVVGDVDLTDVKLELVAGARSGVGPDHQEAAPGAPGGPSGGHPGAEPDPFADRPGPRIKVSGTILWEGEGTVALDLFVPDATASGGQRQLGKLLRTPGPFEINVPVDFGPLVLEAFIDANNNGPGPGDPRGRFTDNPLSVGRTDITGVDIPLTITADGKMPSGEPAQQPPREME